MNGMAGATPCIAYRLSPIAYRLFSLQPLVAEITMETASIGDCTYSPSENSIPSPLLKGRGAGVRGFRIGT